VGVKPAQISGDYRMHAVQIFQDLVIPEPQHTVTLAFQKSRAAYLRFGSGIVLTTVDFDDQSHLVADKVGNKTSDRHLSAKSVPFHLARS